MVAGAEKDGPAMARSGRPEGGDSKDLTLSHALLTMTEKLRQVALPSPLLVGKRAGRLLSLRRSTVPS
jgi:hypothetical protein